MSHAPSDHQVPLYGFACYRCGQVFAADDNPHGHYDQADQRCYDQAGQDSGPIPFGPVATWHGADRVRSTVEYDVGHQAGYQPLSRSYIQLHVDQARLMILDALTHPATT